MPQYNLKITSYGSKEKSTVHSHPIQTGINTSAETRANYSTFDAEQKAISDEKRLNRYKRILSELREIAMMNTDLDSSVTLTFAENMTDYDMALKEFQLFIKRLRYYLYKDDLKYICTWEYQESRSRKYDIKGKVYHFHFLTNTGFIAHNDLEKLWRNGFVWIDRIGTENKRLNAINYNIKYVTKEIIRQIGQGCRGKRFVFTSNNLNRPTVTTVYDPCITIEDVIYENMENMIVDGNYKQKDENGNILNSVDYAIYKKNEKGAISILVD